VPGLLILFPLVGQTIAFCHLSFRTQGRKTRLLFTLYSQFLRRWRVFHEISRAAALSNRPPKTMVRTIRQSETRDLVRLPQILTTSLHRPTAWSTPTQVATTTKMFRIALILPAIGT
jgi:hypothetical protein